MCCLAIAFLAYTGCRPKEAAFVVHNKRIFKRQFAVPFMTHEWQASADKAITKTSHDYFWLLPMEADWIVQPIRRLRCTGYDDFESLKESMAGYFRDRTLVAAGADKKDSRGKPYSMRTIRALRATEWVRLAMEYKVMKWEPLPPNPLSHTNWKTTLTNYAERDSHDEWQARKRCCEKYGHDSEKKQPWMDAWLRLHA